MKHTNLATFENHIAEASVYLVSCLHEVDGKRILERIALKLSGEQKRFDSATLSETILPLTRELSLFGTKRLFLAFDTTLQEEPLLHYLQSPAPNTHLLLGTKETKVFAQIANQAAKMGAEWLDLSSEKPWEREKRLILILQTQVHRAGKSMASDLFPRLIARVGLDWPLLEREVEKLIAFTGSRQEIFLGDIEGISIENKEQSTWQLSEEIVWGQKAFPHFPPFQTSEALALIGALRYQVQLGWQLASTPLDAPPLHIKPYQAQKYGRQAHAKSLAYFEKAILGLFEIEKLLKSSSLDPRLLFTYALSAHFR